MLTPVRSAQFKREGTRRLDTVIVTFEPTGSVDVETLGHGLSAQMSLPWRWSWACQQGYLFPVSAYGTN